MANEVETKIPLEEVAAQIVVHANKSDEHVITAAKLIAEARRRVEAGEAGEVTWYAWAEENIKLKKTRLCELLAIAEAEDPGRALQELRARGRERVAEFRQRQGKAPLRNGGSAGRSGSEIPKDIRGEHRELIRDLIAWACELTFEDLRRAFDQLKRDGDQQEPPRLPAPGDEAEVKAEMPNSEVAAEAA